MRTPRIYQPRQRTDGRWEYSVLEGEGAGAHVVGYCAGWHYDDGTPLDEEAHARARTEVEHLKAKYHGEGHDTEEEARRCFNEYLLDRELKAKDTKEEQACIVCGNDTLRVVSVARLYRWPICIEHEARKEAAALLAQQPALREEIAQALPVPPVAPPQRNDKPRVERTAPSGDRAASPGPLARPKASG